MMQELAAGDLFDRYRIVRKLGAGGMGVVYEAIQPHTEQEVAIKIVPGSRIHNAELRHMITREAKILGRLKHPNIVRVLLAEYRDDGTFYMVTELLRGISLRARIYTAGALSIAEALVIATEVGRALAYGHKTNVIHLDIKPENIFIVGKDENGQPVYYVKLLDYGIARLTRAGMKSTLRGRRFGTAAYSSPEQLKGKPLGPWSDVYSLGVTLYEMICGRHIFATGPGHEGCPQGIPLALAQEHREPEPIPELDELPYIRDPLMKMLRKEASERFQSMGEVLEILTEARARFVRELVASSTPSPRWPVTDRLMPAREAEVVTTEPDVDSDLDGMKTEPLRIVPSAEEDEPAPSAKADVVRAAGPELMDLGEMAAALESLSYDQTLTMLGRLLEHSSTQLRAFAAGELGKIGTERAANELKTRLGRDSSPDVRKAIETAYAAVEIRLAADAEQAALERRITIPKGLGVGDAAADRAAREEIRDMVELEGHVEAIVEGASARLVHIHPAVRAAAADLLAELCSSPIVLADLRTLLEQELHPGVRARLEHAEREISKRAPGSPRSVALPVAPPRAGEPISVTRPVRAPSAPNLVTGPTPAPTTTDAGVPLPVSNSRSVTVRSIALGAAIGIPLALGGTLAALYARSSTPSTSVGSPAVVAAAAETAVTATPLAVAASASTAASSSSSSSTPATPSLTQPKRSP